MEVRGIKKMNKNSKDNQYLLDMKLSELNKDYLIKEGYKNCLIYYLNDLVFDDIKNIEEIVHFHSTLTIIH